MNGININELKNGTGFIKEFDIYENVIFEGEYLNGKKWIGKGKELNNKGIILFEGEYTKGLKNGIGRKVNIYDHIILKGEYLKGEIYLKR